MKILFRVAKVTAIILVVCIVIGILSVWAINQRVVSVGGERLLTVQEAEVLEDVDCILVLGCGVKTDGMSFFVGLKDIGYLDLVDAEEQSSNYF